MNLRRSLLMGSAVGSLLAVCLASSALLAQSPQPPQQAALWRGLAAGMSPEEAAPLITQIEGVKSVKVLAEKRSNPERRLAIRYHASMVPIAGLPFELAPSFGGGRLSQVFLASRDQCAAKAVAVHRQLASSLRTKYAAAIAAPQRITDADVAGAEQSALVSGKPAGLATAFASDEVAVLLIVNIQVTPRPPVPTRYDRTSAAIWSILKSQYDARRAECDGTGDRRMDVVLVYMTRAAYDTRVSKAAEDERATASKLTDQL